MCSGAERKKSCFNANLFSVKLFIILVVVKNSDSGEKWQVMRLLTPQRKATESAKRIILHNFLLFALTSHSSVEGLRSLRHHLIMETAQDWHSIVKLSSASFPHKLITSTYIFLPQQNFSFRFFRRFLSRLLRFGFALS